MSLISFSNVSKSFATDLLLDHISFNVNLGEKVALVGPNGIGKSTIFKLILKEELPTLMPREDKPGAISILNGVRIGYLSQQAISNVNNTVYEEERLERETEHSIFHQPRLCVRHRRDGRRGDAPQERAETACAHREEPPRRQKRNHRCRLHRC